MSLFSVMRVQILVSVVLMFVIFCIALSQDKKGDLIDPEVEEVKVKSPLLHSI